MIKRTLFKTYYNKDMTSIQMNSMFKKNNRQRDVSSFIYRIFSEKLCRFLRLNFEINSILDIFQIFDDEIMAMRKNKNYRI